MSTPKQDVLTFATKAEIKAIRAVRKHGSPKAAGAALGLSSGVVRDRVRRAERRAASRGFAPEYGWNHPVPDGHRIKGNSTLHGADGTVEVQWVKSERDSDDPPAFQAVPEGHLVKKVSTLLDAQGKVRAQWVQAPIAESEEWDLFWAACKRNAAPYKGLVAPTAAPSYRDEDTCTVYPLGDPHIGMLAWAKETGQDFDLRIAERDLLAAVDLLVERAPPSALAILANVGDFFHADDDRQLTQSGHKLDVDSRAAKVADIGFNLMRHLIGKLLTKHASVAVINVPGNHDSRLSRMLNLWLTAVYEREPRVTVVENHNPYIYQQHGKNLMCFAHGDGAKPEHMPGIMAADMPKAWGETEYRVVFSGHVHHQTRKEFPGCTFESFRTLAARDYWHSAKGYRSGQSLSCITLHSEYGEITRSTVDIKLVRAMAANGAGT